MARLLVFTGNGKGKTTAALGLALRAAGHGLRVLIVQFLKHRQEAGEYAGLRRLPEVELRQFGRGFVPPAESPDFALHAQAAREGLACVEQAMMAGAHAVYILDEICGALSKGLLATADVLRVLAQAPDEARVVLTGRDAPAELVAAADTVTEMRCLRHGFDSGIRAQAGVEF